MGQLTEIVGPTARANVDTTTKSSTATATWQALGTSVVLRVADAAALEQAEKVVRAELEAVDRACSRFRSDSELTALNADHEVARRRPLSPLLFEAFVLALRAAELTDGAVDPTLGGALVIAGYDRDWSLLTPPSADAAGSPPRPGRDSLQAPRPVLAVRREGWRAVALDHRTREAHVPAGIQIDLGATAKAWAADRCAAAATAATGVATIIALGGDIATAGDAPASGWSVLVTEDHRAIGEGQPIVIRSGGLATSSTTVRRWMNEGREMHHIIDPATGEPAQGAWRTASVAAGSCADANIAATAAILLSEAAPEWLERHGLPARLVARRDGTVRAVAGWPCEPTADGPLESSPRTQAKVTVGPQAGGTSAAQPRKAA